MKNLSIALSALFISLYSAVSAWAVPIFVLDSTQAIEDVTAAGVVILGVVAIIWGFRFIRRMVGV